MRQLKKLAVLLLVGALTAVSVACADPGKGAKGDTAEADAGKATGSSYKDTVKELVICYLPNEASDEYAEYRSMLEKDISASLGIKVKEVNVADYNAVVEAMRTGKADLALYGAVSYVQAAERANAEALVTAAPNGDRSLAGYTSKIIVKAGSKIKSLEDLKGKTFAFVDPSSTSGNYVPTLELMTAIKGLTNESIHTNGEFFQSVVFSGKHQNGLSSVINGDIDAAPIASNILSKEIAAGRISEKDVVVIHESPKIPSEPFAIRGNLPEDLKAAVKEFFLSYENPEYFEYMLGMEPGDNPKFIEAKDSDYDYVRDLMKRVMPEE